MLVIHSSSRFYIISGQDYLKWVYVENASDELKDLSNFKLRTRRKQLKQQLARALGMLGIPEAKFHGLAGRKQIDEVGLQISTYSLRPKLSTKSYFMKQKCQIQMGIVKMQPRH